MDHTGIPEADLCSMRDNITGCAVLLFDRAYGKMYCKAHGSDYISAEEDAGIKGRCIHAWLLFLPNSRTVPM